MNKFIILSGFVNTDKRDLPALFASETANCEEPVWSTTRQKRAGEKDLTHYQFLKEEEFNTLQSSGDLIDSFAIGLNRYGLSTIKVDELLNQNKHVVAEVGAQSIKDAMRRYPDAITVFILPSSKHKLMSSLSGRLPEHSKAAVSKFDQLYQQLFESSLFSLVILQEDIDELLSRENWINQIPEGFTRRSRQYMDGIRQDLDTAQTRK